MTGNLMSAPLVSIVVPVYNVEELLSRCVDSILAQIYRNFELILVDDGSPDNCGEICDRYAASDSRVRVIHQLNQGLSGARNSGIDIARGEYIAFVDSDDLVSPSFIEYLLVLFMLDPQIDIAVCGIRRSWKNIQERQGDPLVLNAELTLRALLKDDYFGVFACNKLYRTTLFQDIRYPLGELYEDSGIITRLMLSTRKAALGYKQHYRYFNDRSGSIMNEYSERGAVDKKNHLDLMENDIRANFPKALGAFGSYGSRSCCKMLSDLSRVHGQPEALALRGKYRAWLHRYYELAVSEKCLDGSERMNALLWLHAPLSVNRAARDHLRRFA